MPPPQVVRHDGDDPYLVVAADKGTATFSDIANEIAVEYGYWLGDAFASGGSQGYDHKGMGITAKGAWESVKRHFREEGFDTQTQAFTVAGIGDMSGDVFGNGMLLSRHIKLVAAFNHLHVFIDPDPDPEVGFAERERLFALPRSTWDDYDRARISAGGGVFSRAAKSVELSPQARKALGVDAEALTPTEVVKAILQAPVDLLWNGGIGTYVKSASEHNDAVGDRANDAVRVNGSELRCKVVGEGGNLGCTQLGRVEYALAGGRMFTDAIDNSAGVDCSDHEVNIKVLLNDVVSNGDMTAKQRNQLLARMTDDVSALVLRDNYLQTQALSAATFQAGSMLEVHARLIKELERSGDLDPAIEFLPDSEAIAERAQAGKGLTAPELSVLLAYTKITLFAQLMDSQLAQDPFLQGELIGYFPAELRERHRDGIERHRLSREIICTIAANELINRTGITGVYRLMSETGSNASDIASAYLVARQIFAIESVWAEIESLDNVIGAGVQNQLMLESRKLVERACRWLLRHRPQPMTIGPTVARYVEGVSQVAGCLSELVGETERGRIETFGQGLVGQAVPEELAKRVAGFEDLFSALDLVEVASQTGQPVERVASVYFELGERLEFLWMREQIAALPRGNRWQSLARAALRDDLYGQQCALAADVMSQSMADSPEAGAGATNGDSGPLASAVVESWIHGRQLVVERCRQVMSDLRAHGRPDFTMLSVAMREIRAMQVPAAGQALGEPPLAEPLSGGEEARE